MAEIGQLEGPVNLVQWIVGLVGIFLNIFRDSCPSVIYVSGNTVEKEHTMINSIKYITIY
jgi:hypothetical protein